MKRKMLLAAGAIGLSILSAPLGTAPLAASPLQALPLHAAQAGDSDDGAIDARYDITLMGMQIGVAQLKVALEGDRYKADVWTRLTGLAGVMTEGRGAGSASGVLAGGNVVPAAFAVTTASGSRSVSVRMALSGGSVRALKVTPPIPRRENRVPLQDGHTRNIVDPVSALLMPVAGRASPGDPAACKRTLPLFDGSARFDIPLSFTRTQKINGRAWSGAVAVCAGRYLPISGHVPDRADTKFMESNRDIEVWLAPSPDGRLFLPYRIAVRSPLGLVVIEATRFPADAAAPSGGSRQLRASN